MKIPRSLWLIRMTTSSGRRQGPRARSKWRSASLCLMYCTTWRSRAHNSALSSCVSSLVLASGITIAVRDTSRSDQRFRRLLKEQLGQTVSRTTFSPANGVLSRKGPPYVPGEPWVILRSARCSLAPSYNIMASPPRVLNTATSLYDRFVAAGSLVGMKRWQLSRPCALARHIAMSALFIKGSTSVPSSG